MQLDENTLNAYINEAIREELNENIFGQDKLRYRVDFNAMDELVGEPAKADLIRKALNGGEKMLKKRGINPDVLKTAKSALSKGTFGEEDGFSVRGGLRVGHMNQDERQRNNFIKALRNLGYSNQQIHDAIVKSMKTFNGPIYLGTNETGQFIPYTYKKNRKGKAKGDLVNAFEDLWKNLDDAIIHPENYPEPEDDNSSEENSGGWDWLDGAKEKGKNWFEKITNGVGSGELVQPDDNDKNVDWSNPQGINYDYHDDERRHGPNSPSVVDDAPDNAAAQTGDGTNLAQTQSKAAPASSSQEPGDKSHFPWDDMDTKDIQWSSKKQQATPQTAQRLAKQPQAANTNIVTNSTEKIKNNNELNVPTNAGQEKQIPAQKPETAEQTPTKTAGNDTRNQLTSQGPNQPQFQLSQNGSIINKNTQTVSQTLVQNTINNMGKEALDSGKQLKEKIKTIRLLSTRMQGNLYKFAEEGKVTMDQAKSGAGKIKQAEQNIIQQLSGYEN